MATKLRVQPRCCSRLVRPHQTKRLRLQIACSVLHRFSRNRIGVVWLKLKQSNGRSVRCGVSCAGAAHARCCPPRAIYFPVDIGIRIVSMTLHVLVCLCAASLWPRVATAPESCSLAPCWLRSTSSLFQTHLASHSFQSLLYNAFWIEMRIGGGGASDTEGLVRRMTRPARSRRPSFGAALR